MIKANGVTKSGDKFALIGLSRQNIAQLMANQPIYTSAEELGFSGKIAIVFGETEASIAADLREVCNLRGVETEFVETEDHD